MTEPQPEQIEYIITDEILFNKVYLHGYNHKIWETVDPVVHSRPLQPAIKIEAVFSSFVSNLHDFSKDDKNYLFTAEEIVSTIQDTTEELRITHGVDLVRLTPEEEEKRIRQDEREKALEALKKDLRTRFVSSNSQWARGRNSGLLECCNIIDEELRSGKQEGQP